MLRCYVRADWLAQEPDLAEREARALTLAGLTRVPPPGLVASDPEGTGAGVPAVLMTRLQGRLAMAPPNLEHWLGQMAEALPPIHEVTAPETRSRATDPGSISPRSPRPPGLRSGRHRRA